MGFGTLGWSRSTEAAPFYYSYYVGRGRTRVAEQLKTEDPFGLTPVQIVARILATGYAAAVDQPRRSPHFECGETAEVAHGDRWFLVSASRVAEIITVQEIRADAYPIAVLRLTG